MAEQITIAIKVVNLISNVLRPARWQIHSGNLTEKAARSRTASSQRQIALENLGHFLEELS
jgi:hypothetical protein